MTEVEDFIYSQKGNTKIILQYLHDYLIAQPAVTAKIRFRIPFYYRKTWVCYLNPRKDDSVEFCFIRGRELSNDQGLLDHKNRKMVSSVNFKSVKDIPKQALYETIQEALILDESVPFKVIKRKK